MEDPFSIFSFFVPEMPSSHVTPLHPPKEPTDVSHQGIITLPYPDARPIPEVRTPTTSTVHHHKRHHWTIARTATSRTKTKDRDDDDGVGNSWQIPRESQAVDWGTLAVLEGVLQEEMNKRSQLVVEGTEEEKRLDVIRESIDPDTPTAVDDLGEYWSAACAKEAESYVRDVVYGGVDGYAYVRSLAEFVGGEPSQVRVCLLFFS